MSVTEFEIIRKYFKDGFPQRSEVILGVGDDAALCQVFPDQALAISMDTLVENVHFPHNTSPYDLGYKSLAVNLSDLAAMGATPAWMTLALTCPLADEFWLTAFRQGLLELAEQAQISLIGGDLTQGPLTVTIQVAGWVAPHLALRRNAAQPGDKIYVTGYLGDAGLGLASLQQRIILIQSANKDYLERRLTRPTPRLREGISLLGISKCAIDLSDGLAADLSHLLEASQVGATLFLNQLPLSQSLKESVDLQTAWELALSAGDDYELCFTVSPDKEEQLNMALPHSQLTCIGEIDHKLGLRLIPDNQSVLKSTGYQHFMQST